MISRVADGRVGRTECLKTTHMGEIRRPIDGFLGDFSLLRRIARAQHSATLVELVASVAGQDVLGGEVECVAGAKPVVDDALLVRSDVVLHRTVLDGGLPELLAGVGHS